MLHDQKELVRRLNDLIELNDVRMPYYLQDVKFSADSLYIIDIGYLAFLEDFNCDLRFQITNVINHSTHNLTTFIYHLPSTMSTGVFLPLLYQRYPVLGFW